MIKAYNGFKAEKSGSGRAILPAGGYIASIVGAREEETDYGKKLILAFDIAEGEFKGFFDKDFKDNTSEDKKWRGTYRLTIPVGDGTEKDGWSVKKFNNFVYSVEDSNPGYSWDWDEAKLKGKKIGVVFRNEEWEKNGRSGWTTKCGAVYSTSDIRECKFKQLADKPLEKKSSVQATTPFTAYSDADGDLPF